MQKIGITGTIASGKSSVSILIKRHGFPVFNSDRYAGMCLHANHPACEQIALAFPDVIDDNGDVDRKKMAAVVFTNEEKRIQLNSIVHPYVIEGMRSFFARQNGVMFAFAEVPLLFEAGLENEFDKIIVVTCEKETAVKRMMEDRDYSLEEAHQRYDSQIDAKQQIARGDIVLHNDGTLEELNTAVNQMFRTLRKGGRR